jgi:hypothetical protein
MTRYAMVGFRPVEAESPRAAAEVFATREARKLYGRRGYCRTMRLDSWTEDGTSHTFQAFIGRDVKGQPGTTTGREAWLFINRLPR